MGILTVVHNSWYKRENRQASQLAEQDRVAVDAPAVYTFRECHAVGEDYFVRLEASIGTVGSAGYFYAPHVHITDVLGAEASVRLVHLLLRGDWYAQAVATAAAASREDTSVDFVTHALRQVGVSVPEDASPGTRALEGFLASQGFERVEDPMLLVPGDVCFSQDSPGESETPAHVYVFVGRVAQNQARRGWVVDDQGPRHLRNVADPGPCSPFARAYRLR